MMTHALHGRNCFLLQTTHLLIRRHWHGHGVGAQDGRLTNSLLEREKMVSTTSLLRCTTAQRSNMLPSTHNRRWPRFEGPAVLKMDADKKMMDFTVAEACQTSLQPQRYTHHALRTARLGGTCNKSTTLIIRWGTYVQPNFTIVA